MIRRVCAQCGFVHEEYEQATLFEGIAGRRVRPADHYCPRCEKPWRLRATGLNCPRCGAPALAYSHLDEFAHCAAFEAISTGEYDVVKSLWIVIPRDQIARLRPVQVGGRRRQLIRRCGWAGPYSDLVEYTDPEGVRPIWATE